jgi:hypothetical protein
MRRKRQFETFNLFCDLPQTRTYIFKARVTLEEKYRLENAALHKGISMSELFRDWVKRLPKYL